MLGPMRRWFVLLMVVLLPLRAVAGDLMSLAMATAGEPPRSSAGMSPECPMHLAAADPEPMLDEGAAATPSSECGSCALCFPVARLDVLGAVGSPAAADARRAIGGDRFLSAPTLGLLRPPEP
jgi:hypothetical protein